MDGEKKEDEKEGKVLLRCLPTPQIFRHQMGAVIQLH